MNKHEPIYLSYTNADNVASYFQTLESKDGFALVKASAAVFHRVATVVHTRGLVSGRAKDPPIEIICVTNKAFDQEEANEISQAAIHYAMNTGLILFKQEEPRGPSPT